TLRGHTRGVDVSWSPDGKRLATGSEDSTVTVWETSRGRELFTLRWHTRPVNSLSWSPDGTRLATASADGTAAVWQTAREEAVQEWARQDRALDERLALDAPRDLRAQGFIQSWLLLLPLPYSGENGLQALDQQQLTQESRLRPWPGERGPIDGRAMVWQEYH